MIITPKIGKYEFPNKETFDLAFEELHTVDEDGQLVPKFRFSDPVFPKLILKNTEYDEEGNIIEEQVMSNRFFVDFAWFFEDEYNEEGEVIKKEHPIGFEQYKSTIEKGQGLHTFIGIDYQQNKI